MSTDWGGLRAIIDNQPKTAERVDCPVCGTVLVTNGDYYTCPFGGRKHWYSANLPRD